MAPSQFGGSQSVVRRWEVKTVMDPTEFRTDRETREQEQEKQRRQAELELLDSATDMRVCAAVEATP